MTAQARFGRPGFVEAAERHGVAAEVAKVVLSVAEELRLQMMKGHRRDRKEWASTLDFEIGVEYGTRRSGVENEVDVSEQLQVAGGRQVVCVHTHPGSNTFIVSPIANPRFLPGLASLALGR